MTFDTIFNNAMKLYEGINPQTKQQDPNFDDKGQPVKSVTTNPTGTPNTAPTGQQQATPSGTPPVSPTQQQTPPTGQKQASQQTTNPTQSQTQIQAVKLPVNVSNMKTQDFINALSQTAGPEGTKVLQQIVQNYTTSLNK
jgi:hypothetical protein